MASTGKASIKLATAQTLTGTYAATNTVANISISEESLATIDIFYTTGTAETTSYLSFYLEFSHDGLTWVQESSMSLSSGVNTLASMVQKVAGGIAATQYTAQYVVPFCSRHLRIKVKETVAVNFGSVSLVVTIAAASGQQRNVSASSGGGGGGDVNLTQVGGAAVSLGQKTKANSIPVVIASDQDILATSAKQDTGNTSLSSIDGKITACNTGAVTISAALPAGANAIGKLAANSGVDIGDVDVTSLPALVAGSALIGKVGIDQTTPGTTNLVAAGGDVANDSADSGNPLKIGGKALTAQPTAVTANDRVNAMFDVYGRQVKISGLREMKASQITTITASTAETTILTADATYKQDVYGVIVTNTSATATELIVKDSTAGTTRFQISVPANDMRGFMLSMDAGHNQAAVNNNWTGTCADSVSSLVITVFAIKNL